MKITKYSSSTIVIETEDIKILCDPWIEDGEYYGSWFHDEEINKDLAYREMATCDALYISHIHPDHLSEKTIKKLNIKEKTVYVHDFAENFLAKKLERMGFKEVIVLGHGEKEIIKGNTKIAIYAADNCDPSICLKFYGCNYTTDQISKNSHQIDSCMVLSDSKHSLINLNDCMYQMMSNTIKKIKNDYSKIDMLLVNYNSAHAYPQCIKNYDEQEKITIAEEIKKKTLDKSESFIKDFNPSFFIPCAGEYILGSRNFYMNKFFGVNSQDECFEHFSKSKFKNEFVMLNYGISFNLDNKIKPKYIKHDIKVLEKYYKKISSAKLDYDELPIPDKSEIKSLALTAFERLYKRLSLSKEKYDEIVYIKFFENYIKLDLNTPSMTFITQVDRSNSEFIIINMNEKLLHQVLKGPRFAHWNNAEIGSHIIYERSNLEKFNYKVGNTLVYFHN